MTLNCLKKTIFILIFICSLLSIMALPFVYAGDAYEEKNNSEVFLSGANDKSIAPPKVDAAGAIAIDLNSGRVLYSKDANTRRAIASTTKIMTAIVAIENGNLNDTVTVSKRAAEIWGSTIGLKTGEKLTLKELLYGLLLNSGNDASIAIAEHIAGSMENFVARMNAKAEELGLKDTCFKTPHGLDTDGHYSTASDLALIARYALSNPVFSEIVRTVSTQIHGRSLYNTNEMLDYYPGADGVKTGYTGKAGRCLVCSATRDNWRIVSVVLGCATNTVRSESTRKILDYVFYNYKPYTLLGLEENVRNVPVIKGKLKDVPILAVDEIKFPLKHDELDRIKTEIDIPESLEAPVKNNMEVGTIKFSLDGKLIAQSALKTGGDVPHKELKDYFNELFYNWSKMMREGLIWRLGNLS